jgi:ATP-dependent Lhr-like helicase
MPLDTFHPLVADWFAERFGAPTEAQRLGWPSIAEGRNTLIAAPTGSGKTLAAFLVCLDRLWRQWIDGSLEDTTQVVYVSPLKALSNDIQRNLESPLAELRARAEAAGIEAPPIRAMVRTGDTPASQRALMLRRPPHILVTTPESLYLLLTSEGGRKTLKNVKTVIIDEIHALARDKRGSHLALSLERLEALCEQPPVRIGLSATQRPMDEIARFLIGAARVDASGKPDCTIVDVGHVRQLDLELDVPPSELSAVCSNEQWAEIYARLVDLIQSHRSTLVFVNTRRLAERVAHCLTDLLGADAVASHHGSLSKELRQSAETRLKEGKLRAIVATASLEMGIDIGYIDLVCQLGSPRSIATFLQRIGRSGHALGKVPKGRLFPLTRDELIECLALVRSVTRHELDRIEIPEAPLDILAQQVVAAVACEEWGERALYDTFRRAWPYRHLSQADYESIVHMVSEGVAANSKRGAYLHRDRIAGRLRARRGARIAALTSGGAIPETALYRVVAEPERAFVGTVSEDFAVESMAGDVFLLGNTSWRVRNVRGGEVLVRDAEGAAPTIPFWFSEAPGRTAELSTAVSQLRIDLADASSHEEASEWLVRDCGATPWAAEQAILYIATQMAALGVLPTCDKIVFERFFDESGGMQLVIHSPLGARINRAWGLTLRKRFCRSFDFELQASADDDGIVLSLGPQHSFAIEALFPMLGPHNAEELLEQALLVAPMFQARWRWNVTRSLAVLRHQNGQHVPPHMQRFRSDDLLASVFPETVGCLENHSGDVEIPNHPLVRQTMIDCKHEAMDIDGFLRVLGEYKAGGVKFISRDTREPSPFCYELLNANPYAFLDGAALEERRTRAVATRRTISTDELRDLAKLDPTVIAEVRDEAWPTVRSADELHDALLSLVTLIADEAPAWREWFDELVAAGRAATARRPDNVQVWLAAERTPVVSAAFEAAIFEPAVTLPEALQTTVSRSDAWVELVRGRVQHMGPTTAAQLAPIVGLTPEQVFSALEALEGQGVVLRGRFTDVSQRAEDEGPATVEWCERRLLARIHRRTMDGLRRRIQPVEPADFWRFLVQWQHVGDKVWGGPTGTREVLAQLQGCELPAGAWESRVLAARLADYEPEWLDTLFMSGETVWGRLRPPRRDADSQTSSGLTRTMPISLVLRDDLPWLLPLDRETGITAVRSGAQKVFETMTSRGALFFNELSRLAELLPEHLEEALRELAAQGAVTSDAFAAVRKIVEKKRGRNGRRSSSHARLGTASAVGRWSLFPGLVEPPTREAYLDRWCRQLLVRWGVIFREMLTRETAAPAWSDLVPVLRRMEMRGEIRGGRFVSSVAGEQYALPAAVDALRRVRDEAPGDDWLVLSAADPLNLMGILTTEGRLPATHKNAFVLRNGRVAATLEAGRIEFHETLDAAAQWEMRGALIRGKRGVRRLPDAGLSQV